MDIQKFYKVVSHTLEPLVSLVFPTHCLICGYSIASDNRVICLECINSLAYRDSDGYDFCKYCGNALYSFDNICRCLSSTKYYFDEMKACLYYDNVVKHIIHKMKFESHYKICFDFAAILNFYYADYIKSHDVIMPVVLNRKRRRQRGYNQSMIIAKNIARRHGIYLDTKSIKRTKNTKKLSMAKDIDERLRIIDNAFTFNKRYSDRLKGKSILIIDDIFTTGTTVNAMSKVIQDNVSVERIDILCVAKA